MTVTQDGNDVSLTQDVITYGGGVIGIDTNNEADRGTYVVSMTYELEDYPYVTATQEIFTLIVEHGCIDDNAIYLGDKDFIATQDFVLGLTTSITATMPDIIDNLAAYNSLVDTCGSITKTMSVELDDEPISTPGWIVFDFSQTQVTINPSTGDTAGKYVVKMTYELVLYTDIVLVDTHITVNVINACVTNNSINLGSYSALSGTQTFYRTHSDPLVITLPAVED